MHSTTTENSFFFIIIFVSVCMCRYLLFGGLFPRASGPFVLQIQDPVGGLNTSIRNNE